MKILKVLIVLCIPIFLSGCYDKQELDNYAYVIGMGADIGSGENLNITYQIAIPLKLAGEGNNTSGKETYTTYTVSAPSLYAANELVNTISSKELNLSHVKLIIYSEELAKSDLSGHLSSLISNVDIRPKTNIAICKGKAEEFFKEVAPILESSTARYYDLVLDSYTYSAAIADTDLLTFYTAAESLDREATAIITELKEKGTITTFTQNYEDISPEDENSQKSNSSSKSSKGGEEAGGSSSKEDSAKEGSSKEKNSEEKEAKFAGLAVFNGGKMIGEIPPSLVIAHLIVTNNLKEAIITVDDINVPDKKISLMLRQNKNCKINVDIKNDKPQITIDVFLDTHLMSSGSTTNYLKTENKDKLKKATKKEIKEMMSNYLKITTNLNSDIAGFGRYAKKNYLTWDEFKKQNWENIFKNSDFDININIDLNISQVIMHSLENN